MKEIIATKRTCIPVWAKTFETGINVLISTVAGGVVVAHKMTLYVRGQAATNFTEVKREK